MNLAEAQVRTSWWEDADFRQLVEIASRIRCNPADLLLVLFCESRLRPSAVNYDEFNTPQAIGLNQIIASTARQMGLTMQEWHNLSRLNVGQQLPFVERFFASLQWFQNGRSYASAPQLYQANAAPSSLSRGTTPDTVLYRAGDGAYEANRLLDHGRKGTITVGDLAQVLSARAQDYVFQCALLRLQEVARSPNLKPQLAVVGDAPPPPKDGDNGASSAQVPRPRTALPHAPTTTEASARPSLSTRAVHTVDGSSGLEGGAFVGGLLVAGMLALYLRRRA